jgi:hypothetical protein
MPYNHYIGYRIDGGRQEECFDDDAGPSRVAYTAAAHKSG